MLTKARELAEKASMVLTAVILGSTVKEHAKTLAEYTNKVMVVEDAKLENFNSEAYRKVLAGLITTHKPALVMAGHTSQGVDLAPRLAAALNLPLATDCLDLAFESDVFTVTKQMYGGNVKVKANVPKP